MDSNNRNILNRNEKGTPNVSVRKHLNSINRKISYANRTKRIKRTVTIGKREDYEIGYNDDRVETADVGERGDEDEADIELSFDDIKDPDYEVKNNVNSMDESTFDFNGNDGNDNDLIMSNEFEDYKSSYNENDDNGKFNLDENEINHNRTSEYAETGNFIESDDNGIKERKKRHLDMSDSRNMDEFIVDEPLALPLRPIIRGPFDEDEQNRDDVQIVYVEPHSPIKLNCEVDLDIATSVWMKDGQIVQAKDKNSRTENHRFIKEIRGSLTITNVMLEDDGYWQCEAENFRGFLLSGRPIKLVVLSKILLDLFIRSL